MFLKQRRQTIKSVVAVVLVVFFLCGGRIFAFDFEDALEDLTMVTACLGEYNAAQTWEGGPGPYDYYTPDMYRNRFVIESGRRTKTDTFYGVCFDYAQVAWDRIKSYRNYYVNAGMKDNQWYIAANSNDEQYIILYDPVDASKSSYHLNGVPVVEKARYRVIPHRDGIGQPASNHAWIWIQHKNGTWYWLDPTWTDNTGYVCYGIVSNGEEIYLPPSSSLCVNPFPSSLVNRPLPSKPQPTPSHRTSKFSSFSFYDFLDSILPQEDGAMGGIFIGGGDLHQIQEMENQHNLSVGLLVPALFLGDWSNIFYLGGKVEFQRNIDGQKTTAYTLLAGTTISLLLLQPYIEGGVGLSNLNPVFEFTSGYDFSFTVQSPIALGVFYRFQWYSDWKRITSKKQYFGARILIRPHNFSMPSFLEFDGGKYVVSVGYIFPANLLNTKSFDLGSLDNYGFSISLEDADYLNIPGIIALSYRKSIKKENSFFEINSTEGYKQKSISSVKSTTRKTLILELSLGWQLIPHIVLYGGGGIGLAHLTVEEERSKSSSSELAWQVQGGIRFNVMDFLYTRAQVSYLHTKELGLSLHLGLSLF